MTGAKFRMIGLSLLCGAAMAAACGGDDKKNDDDDENPTTTIGPTTTTAGTSQTQTATGAQTTSTTGSPTGMGGTGGSGMGGSAGAGTCQDESTTGGAGEGGAGGENPTSPAENGYTFVNETEVADWTIQANDANCADCVDSGGLAWSCAVMEVTVDWPESANTASQKVVLQRVLEETSLANLVGRSVMATVRMTSVVVANNGYDLDLGLNDFGDGSDWTYHGTCWSGSDTCPANRHNNEVWGPDDGWKTVSLAVDAAESSDFDASGIRAMALQISTKYWAEGTFDYASAPVTFEVGMYVW